MRPDAVIVSCTKGIEQGTHKKDDGNSQEYLPSNPIGVLSGPNHAERTFVWAFPRVLIGFEDPQYADWVQQIFASRPSGFIPLRISSECSSEEPSKPFCHWRRIVRGLNLGDNAQAALLTRGLAEMSAHRRSQRWPKETFMGLSGVGDLIVTCYSRHSRNQTVGRRLAEGKPPGNPGYPGHGGGRVPNTLSVYEIARKLKVRTPLIDAVYAVLYESKADGGP